MRYIIQFLGTALLAALFLSPAPLNATAGVAKDPSMVACTHLKATLRRLHRGIRRHELEIIVNLKECCECPAVRFVDNRGFRGCETVVRASELAM